MYMSTPIIACNSGGPKESVSHGKSGFLLKQDQDLWAEHMDILSRDPTKAKEMGKFGKEHVKKLFGFETFANKSDSYIKQVKYGKAYKKNI